MLHISMHSDEWLQRNHALFHPFQCFRSFTKRFPIQQFIKSIQDAVGAVVAVIVWYLDLQLPMQSVPS